MDNVDALIYMKDANRRLRQPAHGRGVWPSSDQDHRQPDDLMPAEVAERSGSRIKKSLANGQRHASRGSRFVDASVAACATTGA